MYDDAFEDVVKCFRAVIALHDPHYMSGLNDLVEVSQASPSSHGAASCMGLVGPSLRYNPGYKSMCSDIIAAAAKTIEHHPSFAADVEALRTIHLSTNETQFFDTAARALVLFTTDYTGVRNELKDEMAQALAKTASTTEQAMQSKQRRAMMETPAKPQPNRSSHSYSEDRVKQ